MCVVKPNQSKTTYPKKNIVSLFISSKIKLFLLFIDKTVQIGKSFKDKKIF